MATTTRQGRRGGTVRRRRTVAPYVLIAPAVLGFLAIFLAPAVYAGWTSLHGNRVASGSAYGTLQRVFVGFDNYTRALDDPQLVASLLRLLVYAALSIPLTMGLALLFALLLDVPRVRLRATSRTVIFMPYAIPGVIAAMMWGFVYLPSLSPVNALAEAVGIDGVNLLGARAVFGSLANVSVWASVGFNMIVIYTALRAIPTELYDAARVDGCGEVGLALRIKLPMLTPAIVLTGLFSLIGALQTYSEPITFQKISQSISSSFFPLMKVYNDAFFDSDLGIAAATSMILVIGTLVLSGVLLGLVSRRAMGDD